MVMVMVMGVGCEHFRKIISKQSPVFGVVPNIFRTPRTTYMVVQANNTVAGSVNKVKIVGDEQ
jgi:hypothetical protein